MNLNLAPIDINSTGHAVPAEEEATVTVIQPPVTEPTPTATVAEDVEENHPVEVDNISQRFSTYEFQAADGWRARVISHALALLGHPYRWGGTSPGGFDCSGLVQYVYADVGLAIPRTAREMYYAAQPLTVSDLKPGDLVFFVNPDHVGIWIGDGEFIHASSGRKHVTISSLATDRFYQRRFIGCGRLAN